MTPDPCGITQLLRQWGPGDRQADDRLFELLLPDLRKIAGRCFRRERLGHTLQPTATDMEAADALNLTLHTIQREWYRSRRWLYERLSTQP